MSIASTLQRITTIEQTLANPASLVNASTSAELNGGTAAPAEAASPAGEAGTFAQALQSASEGYEGQPSTPPALTTSALPATTTYPSAGATTSPLSGTTYLPAGATASPPLGAATSPHRPP
jgi:hypothetical protein